MPGGCLFTASAWELDDREGPVRDALVEALGAWMQILEKAAGIAGSGCCLANAGASPTR